MLLVSTPPGGLVKLLPIDEIQIPARDLTMNDIIDLSMLPASERAALGPQVVVTLASDRNIAEVNSAVLESWARRKVPGLRFEPAPARPVKITYGIQQANFSRSDKKPASRCSELVSPAVHGDILVQTNTLPVPCDDRLQLAPVYFDRKDGVVRAVQNLSAGTYLGQVALPDVKVIDRGREMVFVAYDGPVRVERNVRALQAAKAGERFFVTTGDGSVIATRYLPAEETEQ